MVSEVSKTSENLDEETNEFLNFLDHRNNIVIMNNIVLINKNIS